MFIVSSGCGQSSERRSAVYSAVLNYYRPMTVMGGSRVNKVRVRIMVSVKIRVSSVLVIGWTNEIKPNPNPKTNLNRNPTYPTIPYHLTVYSE